MGPTEMGKTLAVLSGKSNLREEGTVFCDCACMFIVCWTTLGCRTGWEDACIGFWRCSGSPVSHWSQLCSGTATCSLIQGMHGVPLAHCSRQEHSFASAYIHLIRSALLCQMFRSQIPGKGGLGFLRGNRRTSEGWQGLVSVCTYGSSPGSDPSEHAAACAPEAKAGDAWYRYWFWSALHLLLPAIVGRPVLPAVRSPFNLDMEL